MNRCLLTGATGFLGKYLVEALLQQGQSLTILVRNPASNTNKALLEKWKTNDNFSAVKFLKFDLAQDDLALDSTFSLADFDHVYHLAAIYDLSATKSQILDTNVGGTRKLLSRLQADGFKGCFHFVSSIAVAGNYEGRFDETMFDEGQEHQHAYHLSKYESEAVVREFKQFEVFKVRIYRPSAIVGHSTTGYIDKIDGPYYLFLIISVLKRWLPGKTPLVLPKTAFSIDLVPVDYVANSLAYLSLLHEDLLPNGQFCFHLSDPNSPTISEVFSQVLTEADGPSVAISFSVDKFSKFIFADQFKVIRNLQAIHIIKREFLKSLNIPVNVFDALMPKLKFEAHNTLEILKQGAIHPPGFTDYVSILWEYYNKNLDPHKNRLKAAAKHFNNKRVLITGGSSGIGFESAKIAFALGAKVIIVARDKEKLKQCEDEIRSIENDAGEIFLCM